MMTNHNHESKKNIVTASIWSAALLLVLAVGMMTFFTAASRKAGNETDKQKQTEHVTEEVKSSINPKPEEKKETEVATQASVDTEKPESLPKADEPAKPSKPAAVMTEEVAQQVESPVTEGLLEVPTTSYPASENFTCVMPVSGSVIKAFTEDVAVYSLTMNDYRVHNGIDIYAPIGTKVTACAAGTVERVWEDPFLGNCIQIHHGGDIRSIYSNLSPELPKGMEAGKTVLAGDVIGGVGDSMTIEMADSDHLHFCMTDGGVYVNPLDYITNYQGDGGVDFNE